MLFIKCCFGIALALVLGVGVMLFKNWNALFGSDPNWKSESSGAATYSKMQAIVLWLIIVKLLIWMTFFH